MKCIVVILAVVSAACGASLPAELKHTAYGYLERFGVPQWEQMVAAAKQPTGRIVGGLPASLGQFPYVTGLLFEIHGMQGNAVCGGSLISQNRVLTAAHCWFDGQHQAFRVTVATGTINLVTGGSRVTSVNVITHGNWNPFLANSNDIAVIRLTSNVFLNANTRVIDLPFGAELDNNFFGHTATIAGYGHISHGGSFLNLMLYHANVVIMDQVQCRLSFNNDTIQNTHMCASGVGGSGPCIGDFGGPLTVFSNGVPVLIGVSSFKHPTSSCQSGLPSVYTRVSSYLTWIRAQL